MANRTDGGLHIIMLNVFFTDLNRTIRYQNTDLLGTHWDRRHWRGGWIEWLSRNWAVGRDTVLMETHGTASHLFSTWKTRCLGIRGSIYAAGPFIMMGSFGLTTTASV